MKGKYQVNLYGTPKFFATKRAAASYLMEGMMSSEGSEQDRYTTAYCELMEGKTVVSDGDPLRKPVARG